MPGPMPMPRPPTTWPSPYPQIPPQRPQPPWPGPRPGPPIFERPGNSPHQPPPWQGPPWGRPPNRPQPNPNEDYLRERPSEGQPCEWPREYVERPEYAPRFPGGRPPFNPRDPYWARQREALEPWQRQQEPWEEPNIYRTVSPQAGSAYGPRIPAWMRENSNVRYLGQ